MEDRLHRQNLTKSEEMCFMVLQSWKLVCSKMFVLLGNNPFVERFVFAKPENEWINKHIIFFVTYCRILVELLYKSNVALEVVMLYRISVQLWLYSALGLQPHANVQITAMLIFSKAALLLVWYCLIIWAGDICTGKQWYCVQCSVCAHMRIVSEFTSVIKPAV